jgi:hypothetical protein
MGEQWAPLVSTSRVCARLRSERLTGVEALTPRERQVRRRSLTPGILLWGGS